MKLYIEKEDIILCAEKAEELAENVWLELYFATSNREMLKSIAKGLETLCEQENYDSAFSIVMAYKEIAMLGVKDIDSQYFSYVYKFVLALCHDSHMAEEITRETFFKALKSIDDFEGKANVSSWLCQIAKNTYFKSLKKDKRNEESSEISETVDYGFEEEIENKELALEIHKALHTLEMPYKEVFWLRTFADLSFSQIGALFEKSDGWARVTYYRAKIMIKKKL